ncbi:MAG: hypothetical protein EAZ89_06290 [Bacteroidetes bacterium]|nr:MAG: hypothetical protein EAZ89_06290 [Bacteroidota bacterium]
MKSSFWPAGVFAAALILRLALTCAYLTTAGSDRNLQALAGMSLLEHQGLTLPEADPQDVSALTRQALMGWPAGYSLLFAAARALGLPVWTAVWLIEIAGVLLVFGGLWTFARQMLQKNAQLWLFTCALLSFSPLHYTSVTDEYALGLFLMGLSCFQGPDSKRRSFFGLLLIGCAAWMRFAYWPLMLTPVWVWALQSLRPEGKKSLSWLMAGLIVAILTLASYSLFSTPGFRDENVVSARPGLAEWHVENLLMHDAFPIKAFLYTSIDALAAKSAVPAVGIMLLKGVFILISAGILLPLLLRYIKGAHFLKNDLLTWGVPVLLLCWASLLYFSLVNAPVYHDGRDIWTFVGETRYFAPAMIIVQLFVCQVVANKEDALSRVFGIGLILFLLLAAGHSALRIRQLLAGSTHETRFSEKDQLFQEVFRYSEEAKGQGQEVCFVAGNLIAEEEMRSIAALGGAHPLRMELACAEGLSASTEMVVIVYVPENEPLCEHLQSMSWQEIYHTSAGRLLQARLLP